jgi:hypothetical protein
MTQQRFSKSAKPGVIAQANNSLYCENATSFSVFSSLSISA